MPGRKSLGIITSHDHPSTVSHRAGRDESKKRRRQGEDKSEWVEGGDVTVLLNSLFSLQ